MAEIFHFNLQKYNKTITSAYQVAAVLSIIRIRISLIAHVIYNKEFRVDFVHKTKQTNKHTLTVEATGKLVTDDPLSRTNDTLSSGLGKGKGRWEPDGGGEDALCGG